MVTGLNIFRDYFADDTDKYVLIGGAACSSCPSKEMEVASVWNW
jgi:hypothetical protein